MCICHKRLVHLDICLSYNWVPCALCPKRTPVIMASNPPPYCVMCEFALIVCVQYQNIKRWESNGNKQNIYIVYTIYINE